MTQRKDLENLHEWNKNKYRKPLVSYGARWDNSKKYLNNMLKKMLLRT
jgi:hypothetical protein